MRIAGRDLGERLVIAGVGNRERADDGFGPALARRLLSRGWKNAIDCGDRLEDFTADIAAKRPKMILIADVIEMNAQPGETALLDISEVPPACHAHDSSLRLAMEYLRLRTGAEVMLLGVQPGAVSEGNGLSREVEETLNQTVAALTGCSAPGGNSDREDQWTL